MTITPVTIIEQGAPRVDATACVHHRSESVATVTIDMHSKRCDLLDATTEHGKFLRLAIGTIEESLHLDESKPRESLTIIELPEFAGWEVWLSDISRYTLRLCLVKRE